MSDIDYLRKRDIILYVYKSLHVDETKRMTCIMRLHITSDQDWLGVRCKYATGSEWTSGELSSKTPPNAVLISRKA